MQSRDGCSFRWQWLLLICCQSLLLPYVNAIRLLLLDDKVLDLWYCDERSFLSVYLASAFKFYVQFFNTSLFPTFSLFKFFSKYKYTLAHFQIKVFSKKLYKLFPNIYFTAKSMMVHYPLIVNTSEFIQRKTVVKGSSCKWWQQGPGWRNPTAKAG